MFLSKTVCLINEFPILGGFLITILFSLRGCGVLQNGVSYSGQDKIFSKNWNGTAVKKRMAIGREPGWELGFSFTTTKEARLRGVWIKNPIRGNVPVSVWDADTKQLIQVFFSYILALHLLW